MTAPLPIWIRLPKAVRDAKGNIVEQARCYYTGISAGKMFDLAVPSKRNKFAPPVKSVSVPTTVDDQPGDEEPGEEKRPGRFVRLINLPSLLAYLDGLADAQAKGEGK